MKVPSGPKWDLQCPQMTTHTYLYEKPVPERLGAECCSEGEAAPRGLVDPSGPQEKVK